MVRRIPSTPGADLGPTLPSDCPLRITRAWDLDNGRLVLRFVVRNSSTSPLQIGALGLPMVFNNIITERALEQAHAACSFFDPYIGQDAGYLQVTRLSGRGPALLVVPDGKTPFEAYRPLSEPTRPSQTFEGTFEWMVHSQAYAENEWRGADPWNPPTLATLSPGDSRTYGLRFLLADQIRHIEDTLAANGRPVAIGVPGYILPMDLDGKLFLSPGRKVKATAVEPPGAITVHEGKPTRGGWKDLTLRGKTWGRARLTVTYDDGTNQSHQLHRHQARGGGRRGPGQFPHDPAVVHGPRRPVPPQPLGDQLRPRGEPAGDPGQPRLDRRPGR